MSRTIPPQRPQPVGPTTSAGKSINHRRSSIDRPEEACREGAWRLNAVMIMLAHHSEHCCRPPGRDVNEDTGGYELSIMREALTLVRDMLRSAAQQ